MYLEERMIKMIDIGQECFTNENCPLGKKQCMGVIIP